MGNKRLARRLEQDFGQIPAADYTTEDIQGIRAYYLYRMENGMDAFYVDDGTWRDLSMGGVYKRLNATQSTSGEQVLYHMLRAPSTTAEEFGRRNALIEEMGENKTLRLRLQCILARVGKRRAANTTEVFSPKGRPLWALLLSIFLVVGSVASLVGLLFSSSFLLPMVLFLFANPAYHAFMTHRLESDLATVNYAASMVVACRKMERVTDGAMEQTLRPFFLAGNRAKSVARFGGISFAITSDIVSVLNTFFLLDLLSYEWLKNRLVRHSGDIFLIHETLGRIDAAIAVASWRKSLGSYATPEIDFAPQAKPSLHVRGLVHPMVEGAVPNDLAMDGPILVTGSNASGKSTFLKALALGAVLGQGICTVPATQYRAPAFHIYASMAITDNVFEGDSYFVAEIKSILRIVRAAAQGGRILCVIDEVLRGTNTVERVAASSELLQALGAEGVLCMAATHDGELCSLLPGYRNVHFEEAIQDGAIHFDYLLREGPATTRNAIRLLGLLGFDEGLVQAAEARAQRYLQSGAWS